jgi:hypothetical protein
MGSMKTLRVSSIVVSAVLLMSCGADSQDSEATSIATVPPNGESITIQVLDNSYLPLDFEIAAGT